MCKKCNDTCRDNGCNPDLGLKEIDCPCTEGREVECGGCAPPVIVVENACCCAKEAE